MLHSFKLQEYKLDETNPFKEFLIAIAYAIRSTYHTTLKATPAQLLYGHEMILPVQFITDWALIAQCKQEDIHKSTARKNKMHISYAYNIGDKVFLDISGIKQKMSATQEGTYMVPEVYKNGTVHIQHGIFLQRVNICRIIPYK